MKHTKTTLANGLRVISVPIPTSESVTVTVWAGVGSRHETPKIGGISHFLEHMVFKGSQKRPTAQAIAESVDAIGAEFNAGTSKEWTNFYIKARNANVEHAFDVLSDMVLHPILREEDIEREKGVILEEIAMYEDTPTAKIGDNFENLIFGGHKLGMDIIGTRESVKGIKKTDFVNHRKKHYYSNNLLVCVSGGVKNEDVVSLTKKYFGELKKGKTDSYASRVEKFAKKQTRPAVLLDSQKREQAHFIVGFIGEKRGNPDRFAAEVLTAILGGGMSSRLFTEVREKRGLAYSVRSSVENYVDTGYLETYAGVDLKKVDEAIKVILHEIYSLRDGVHVISDAELTKAKEFIKGHFALSLENTRRINHFLGEEELIMGRVETPEVVYKGIDAVSIDDILAVAKKILVPSKLNLAIIGPYKDQARFEKLVRE